MKERVVGKFGLDERNNRGQALVDFAARYNLRIMNTFFTKLKSRKWTVYLGKAQMLQSRMKLTIY